MSFKCETPDHPTGIQPLTSRSTICEFPTVNALSLVVAETKIWARCAQFACVRSTIQCGRVPETCLKRRETASDNLKNDGGALRSLKSPSHSQNFPNRFKCEATDPASIHPRILHPKMHWKSSQIAWLDRFACDILM